MKTELLGCLEKRIIDILWEAGEALKPADVQAKLGDNHAYTTVMTILKRLSDKGILKRQLVGKVYFYYPSTSKQEFIKNNLSDIYGNLVDSYGKLAISQFVDSLKGNREDLELLKKYLDGNS
ncbi:MAG TPA: BlaI/MecI/CopY family transcriptional regulator [Patescibacteria group bacterium]